MFFIYFLYITDIPQEVVNYKGILLSSPVLDKAPVLETICQISAFAFISLFFRISLLFIRHSTHYINAVFLDGSPSCLPMTKRCFRGYADA